MSNFRSPVCCVLGHVDAGKSSTLDKIRGTKFQKREAGGITQNITAWNLSVSDIKHFLDVYSNEPTTLPGLLMIDTPGHEAFIQLRTTGANLCDIAILVVDIHKGIEKQTIESIQLLKESKTPFVIAMNKLDTLSGWKSIKNGCFKNNSKEQSETSLYQLKRCRDQLFLQFANLGINIEFYNQNRDYKTTVNVVPVSAQTGEGIPDLLTVLLRISEKFMKKRIEFHRDHFRGLVLKEDRLPGHGIGYNVLLIDGILDVNSKLYFNQYPTSIKTILKYDHNNNQYHSVASVTAACACIIVLSQPTDTTAITTTTGTTNEVVGAGSTFSYAANSLAKLSATGDKSSDKSTVILSVVKKGIWGVWLYSNTFGTLHALHKLFTDSGMPIAGYQVGPIYKADLMKMATLGLIVNFGSELTDEAEKFAKCNNVTIISDSIVYRLLEQAQKYQEQRNLRLIEESQAERALAIYPCKLSIEKGCVFRAYDPIIIGVKVIEGSLKKGTPLCCFSKTTGEIIEIGTVYQMKTPLGDVIESVVANKTASIEIRDSKKKVGVHFQETDLLYSSITRKSLDALKLYFKGDLTSKDIKLLSELKNKKKII